MMRLNKHVSSRFDFAALFFLSLWWSDVVVVEVTITFERCLY